MGRWKRACPLSAPASLAGSLSQSKNSSIVMNPAIGTGSEHGGQLTGEVIVAPWPTGDSRGGRVPNEDHRATACPSPSPEDQRRTHRFPSLACPSPPHPCPSPYFPASPLPTSLSAHFAREQTRRLGGGCGGSNKGSRELAFVSLASLIPTLIPTQHPVSQVVLKLTLLQAPSRQPFLRSASSRDF